MPTYTMYVSTNTNEMHKAEVEKAIKRNANTFKIAPELIRAIIQAETKAVPMSFRFEPHLKEQTWYMATLTKADLKDPYSFCSMGEMQVLYGIARHMGYKGNPAGLFVPSNNIAYGTKLLKQLCERYGDLRDAISAYNMGRPLKYKKGEKEGQYRNQAYVDKVIKHYKQLGGKRGL